MKQATIIIRDEVNVKIEGLDLDCRKKDWAGGMAR